MNEQSSPPDFRSLEEVLGPVEVAARVRGLAPGGYDSAAGFWAAIVDTRHLSPRMRELVLVALHSSSSSINEDAIVRHVSRARAAGASEEDVLDVLLSIVGLANHSLYFSIPIMLEEFSNAGGGTGGELPELRADIQAIKDDFVKTRGFWNEQRDQLARLMPDYFKALSRLSMEPWKSGALSPKEREFVYIAIDSSITHMHEPGLRMHLRNAMKHGATREEVLEVFQLASLVGMESYIQGCQALENRRKDDER